MYSDALTAGVKHGGLHSRTEIRVLICYILDNLSVPVSLERVKERLHFDGIANYFELTFAITELEENGNIGVVEEEDGVKYYIATGDCSEIAKALGNSVPFSVRERALEIAKQVIDRRRNQRENKVFKEKTEHGVYVTCSVMDRDLELATVKLLVPDDNTANIVTENFLKDPISVLAKATEGLTGTKI